MGFDEESLRTIGFKIVIVLPAAVWIIIDFGWVSPNILLSCLNGQCVNVVIRQVPSAFSGACCWKLHLSPSCYGRWVLLYQHSAIPPFLETGVGNKQRSRTARESGSSQCKGAFKLIVMILAIITVERTIIRSHSLLEPLKVSWVGAWSMCNLCDNSVWNSRAVVSVDTINIDCNVCICHWEERFNVKENL